MANILVVDDELAIVETMTELLAWEGHVVTSASDGARALAALRNGDDLPDLVILDFMMPVKDGARTLREMREDARLADLPVLLMTAAPMSLPRDMPQYQALLVKPFGLDALRAAVAKTLDPGRHG